MDRLEQIRDLGKSLGYEEAELREFVTERERIERQGMFEEREARKLEVETEREDKRLADERETQRLALEAEREDKRLADEMEYRKEEMKLKFDFRLVRTNWNPNE